jgi:predicted enzyme related to lactoylglutathione lyase
MDVNSATPGRFCWIELATSDAEAAKAFYGEVFGWSFRDNDMGEMGKYTIFLKRDRDAAAAYPLMPDQKAQGVPPNWASYVAVLSAEDTAAKAQSLGATVIAPPFDVNDFGRMAVLQDPQGAVFCIWEPKTHIGVTIFGEDGSLCWNELATKDPAASLDFYSKLFGWTGKVSPEYTEIHLGETGIGGMRTIAEGDPTPPNWMPYFLVNDCNAVTDKVQARGGNVCVPPTDIPHVGRFSVVNDPQGAFFAMITPSGM